MPTVKFGKASLLKLVGVDPRLVKLIMHLDGKELDCDLTIYETSRTLEKQKEYVAKGVSKTLDSDHIPNSKGVCNAVDIVPYVNGQPVWDEKLYAKIIPKIKDEAIMLGLGDVIDFGHYWKSFKDSPHIEINKEYQL